MSLVGGGPLKIESLETTLKLVTFWFPIFTTWHKFNRLCRELQRRGLSYSVDMKPTPQEERVLTGLNMRVARLTVGSRAIDFGVDK